MAEFVIQDDKLTALSGKVIVITGGSSGIGLSTVELLLSLGASVVSGDVQPPQKQHEGSFTFVKTDVSVWSDLVALFKKAKEVYGRIDHVFANAGLGPRADYLSTQVDDNGDLIEPSHALMEVSFKGVVNTCTLAIYYMRQQPEGGSIVISGSTTGLQRVRAVDYSSAKHGVIGFGRGLVPLLDAAKLPIRVNTLAPSWTESSVLPELKMLLGAINVELQPASVVSRCTAFLMADESRNGQLVHSERGKFKEIDEALYLPLFGKVKGEDYPFEDDVLRRLGELA
ncbi:short-chain dehydrogenase [Fusarium longipes]|uniref:Short-chain dehydrogenase n=1 Tax=Fusarium longipes TaxID=694270 RepID=A0A395SR64_9HYPO|nr:short-chain dehydrogenase [Fusarium longipes]